MNKIETLAKEVVVNGTAFEPHVYVTAWGKWCICYMAMFRDCDNLCSVVVMPDSEPLSIEDSFDGVGNTKGFDEAIDMIKKYVEDRYLVGNTKGFDEAIDMIKKYVEDRYLNKD